MKKKFKASPKTVTAAIELDERFNFEFPDKEFEVWGNGEYAKCTVVDDKVVDENEVEYTIAMEYPENYWDLERFLLMGIDEYMHELTDGSDYSFDAIVEKRTPKYFYGSDDMYVYTATVNVFAVATIRSYNMKRKFKVFASTEKLSGKELDINYIRYLASDGPFDGEKVKYLTDDDISIIIDMLNSEYPNGVDEQKLFEFLCYDADTYAEWLGFEDSDALWEAREPNYNYLVESFLQDNFRGLVDDAYVEDLDEAIDIAHEFIGDGGSILITNMVTGESQGFTYDEYFDIGEDGLPNSDFAESPFDRNLLACDKINSSTAITASAWRSPSGRKYGKQTRRFPGKYLFTRKELKQMVDNGDAGYIGGKLDPSSNYDIIGISWNETNGHRTGILIEDKDTGELLVGNEGSALVARY